MACLHHLRKAVGSHLHVFLPAKRRGGRSMTGCGRLAWEVVGREAGCGRMGWEVGESKAEFALLQAQRQGTAGLGIGNSFWN